MLQVVPLLVLLLEGLPVGGCTVTKPALIPHAAARWCCCRALWCLYRPRGLW